MATRKETVTENTEPAVQTPVDEWEQTVEILVPRHKAGEDQFYYVCVNDRRFQIPANGRIQKMPYPVAEVLKQSLQDEYDAEDFAEHIPHNEPINGVI